MQWTSRVQGGTRPEEEGRDKDWRKKRKWGALSRWRVGPLTWRVVVVVVAAAAVVAEPVVAEGIAVVVER